MSDMHEIRGDLWTYWEDGYWVVITTNGSIRSDGHAVMGRGVAKEAAQAMPGLALDLGTRLAQRGNVVHVISHRRVFTFPVKTVWETSANLTLIDESAAQLAKLVRAMKLDQVYMVRPGCGNGGLSWEDVKPVLAKHLDGRFVVVEKFDKRG